MVTVSCSLAWRASRLAGLAALLWLSLTAAAIGDVRTASAPDGPDPGVAFDVAQVSVRIDRDSGVATLNASFHQPIPTSGGSGLSYFVAWVRDAEKDACIGSSEKVGDTYINVQLGASGELTATRNVKFRNEYPDTPVTVGPDRKSMSVSFTDELLRQGNPRCLAASGSGQSAYDPSQPGGGSSYDLVDSVWFDGQAPAPAPSPGAGAGPGGTAGSPGTPGQSGGPSCDKPLLSLKGATQVARGSTGQIDAIFADDYSSTYAGDAKVVMADARTGKTFFKDTIGDDLGPDRSRVSMFIDLDPERRPATVTLTWTQRTLQEVTVACSSVLRVKAIKGKRPSFYVRGGSSGELVPRGARCWETRGERVTVTVAAGGRRARFTRTDACLLFKGRGRTIGGVRVARNQYGSIDFFSRSRGSARVTVKVGRRTVLRRTVVSRQRSRPDRRVWEGTDAFFNYCLKLDKELFSSGLRLYCIKPGSYSEAVLFR